jgi:hypothetical protein
MPREHGRGGARPHGHDYPWSHRLALLFEPKSAGGDLAGVGTLVQTPLAARLEFEVLDGVGDKDPLAVEPRATQGLIEDSAGGPHERTSGEILGVAGLLSHQHDRGPSRSFAADRLGRMTPKIAAAARGEGFVKIEKGTWVDGFS